MIVAAVSAVGLARASDPIDDGNEVNVQRCTGSGSCSGAAVPGGVCASGTSPCCCKIAPAIAYSCQCRSATFCTTPGGGNHCDDSWTP